MSSTISTVIDIWGGEGDQDHVARFLRVWDAEAVSLVSRELSNGFLVNVRREIAWGDESEFDERAPGERGLN